VRRLVPAALLTLGCALAACGCGSGDPKKERREFLAKANAICNQYEAEQNAVRFPSVNPLSAAVSHTDRARWGLALKQIVDLGRQEVKALRDVEAPKALRDRFQELIDRKTSAFGDLARGADAAKRNHRTQIKAPVDSGRKKLAGIAKLAQALGAPKCA
jgi:hypothetical protein